MSKLYLPEAIYERLPIIYLTLAALLAVLGSGFVKWPLIAVLALAAMLIRRRRRSHRETLHWRRAAAFIDRLEQSRKEAKDRKSRTGEVEVL